MDRLTLAATAYGVVGPLEHVGGATLSDVLWTAKVNVTATGTSLEKTGGADAWDAGAAGTRTISGDGYVEFTSSEANRHKACSISTANPAPTYFNGGFQIYLNTLGQVFVYESGVSKGASPISTYIAGDVFKVQVSGSTVTYYKNGALLYTSLAAAPASWLACAGIRSVAGTILDAKVYGVDV